MHRRDLILAFGTATAALVIAPEDARAAWARLAADGRPIRSRQLTPAQLALVAAVADTIIPRTDTPGAVDVGVPAFVEAVVDASWPEDDRATFTGGLNALQSRLG
ncbi:MAG TPA: gluconate 2-dehydrogenase subunit 3 family protein, partial [Gemmatimonadaceae bacterium]|nr:gluconate 2-dehydrogenase subunit 3 family protein [Gemmatimonadaceae bacterium]